MRSGPDASPTLSGEAAHEVRCARRLPLRWPLGSGRSSGYRVSGCRVGTRRERRRGEERGRAKGDPNGPPAAPPLLLTVRPLSPPSPPAGPVPDRGRPEPSEPAPPGSTIRAGNPGLRVLSPVLAVPAEAAGWELGGGIAAPVGPRAPAGRDAARGWLRRGRDRAASVSAPSKCLWSRHRRRHQLTPARGSGTAGSRNLSPSATGASGGRPSQARCPGFHPQGWLVVLRHTEKR